MSDTNAKERPVPTPGMGSKREDNAQKNTSKERVKKREREISNQTLKKKEVTGKRVRDE